MTEQAAACAAAQQALAAEAEALAAQVASRKAMYEAAAAELEAHRARARQADKEMGRLARVRERATKALSEQRVESKKLEHKVARLQKDAEDATVKLGRLNAEFPWIRQERPLFGRAGSDYDFSTRSADDAKAALASALEAQDKLGKSINKKVLAMFDRAEQEYKELMQKRSIVLNDKAKIEQVIAELDEKKKAALEVRGGRRGGRTGHQAVPRHRDRIPAHCGRLDAA